MGWVTAFPLAAGQIVGTECVGQKVAKGRGPDRMVDEHLRSAVLQQHLPAPAARHQQLAVGGHTRQGDQPAATAGIEGADH